MKIAQINAVYGFGSTGRSVRELHEWLLAEHIDSRVYSSVVDKGVDSQSIVPIGTPIDHKFHSLASRISGWQAHYSMRATRRLINDLKGFSPDVVILRNLHANYVSLSSLLGFLSESRIPTVVYLDDCWFFTGKCTHYTVQECFRWKESCGLCPKLKDDIPSWFFDKTSAMLEEKRRLFSSIPRLGVVGVSDWVLAEGMKGVLSSASNCKRIYNWIDLSCFRKNESAGIDVRNRFGIVGKMILCVSSGWPYNSRRTANLREISKLIKPDETLIIVGQIANEDIPMKAVHIPPVNNTDALAALYNAADVYLHLGEEDTFGKVIAEALACDTPVVSFNSTVYPELVSDGCGIAVDRGDFKSMRRALDDVLYGSVIKPGVCAKKASLQFDSNVLMPELLSFLIEVATC